MAWKHHIDTTRLPREWSILLDLGQKLVNKYGTMGSHAEPDDLLQACALEFSKILEGWDRKRSLVNWAWKPLCKAVFREARTSRTVVLPEERALEVCHRARHAKEFTKLVKELSKGMRETTLILDELEELRTRMERALRNGTPMDSLEMVDTSKACGNELDFETRSHRSRLQQALTETAQTARERHVLREVLIHGRSHHSVAEDLHTSHTTVGNIARQLLKRLHTRLVGRVEIECDWEYGDCA